MHNSVTFSTFPVLDNHHHYLVPEHFRHPKGNPYPLSSHSPFLPPPSPDNLSLSLPSVSVALPILGKLHERNHTVCGHFWLTSFVQHDVFEVGLCCSVGQYFIPTTAEERSIVRVCQVCFSIHPLRDIWVLCTFCHCE